MITKNEIALYLSGQPVLVKECSLVLTQPTIKQIAMVGEDEFLQGVQIFANYKAYAELVRASQGEGIDLSSYSDFQLLMAILNQEKEIKANVGIFFQLVCPNYNVKFLDHMIAFSVKDDENSSTVAAINPFTLERFAEVVKNLFLMKNENEVDYNPGNDKAKAIKEKILEGRRKVSAQKQIKEGKNTSLFGSYASIVSIGMSIDINTIYNYTPFQIYDTILRYYAKVSWDFYQKVSTTPLMDTSKMETPEEWGRNFYKQ